MKLQELMNMFDETLSHPSSNIEFIIIETYGIDDDCGLPEKITSTSSIACVFGDDMCILLDVPRSMRMLDLVNSDINNNFNLMIADDYNLSIQSLILNYIEKGNGYNYKRKTKH